MISYGLKALESYERAADAIEAKKILKQSEVARLEQRRNMYLGLAKPHSTFVHPTISMGENALKFSSNDIDVQFEGMHGDEILATDSFDYFDGDNEGEENIMDEEVAIPSYPGEFQPCPSNGIKDLKIGQRVAFWFEDVQTWYPGQLMG